MFVFISFALGDRFQGILLTCMSKNVLLYSLLGVLWFQVLCLGL